MTSRYTLGRAKDNLSTAFSESPNDFNFGLLDPFDPRLDYGYADVDIRNRLTVGTIWEMPFARDSKGLVRALVGGWQMASLVRVQSGAPFTVYDCTNGNSRCIRMLAQPGLDRTPGAVTTAGAPNTFTYLDLASQSAGIGAYAHPLTGTSTWTPSFRSASPSGARRECRRGSRSTTC